MFSYFASKAKVVVSMNQGSVMSLCGEKMVVVRAASWQCKTLHVTMLLCIILPSEQPTPPSFIAQPSNQARAKVK